ncbi:MAG TPA: hypothetical protein VE057_02265 [Archangium sp.]|nr:hypothetical protein [Archangium sp.]
MRSNALYLLSEALESIQRKDPYEQSGRPYVEVAYFYRRMALCELLSDARVDRFFVLLCKSAQVRRHFLQLVANGHPAIKTYTCASKNFSFMDALAAGQIPLAAQVARLTQERHEPSCEYEEDFLFHNFLHRFTMNLQAPGAFDAQSLLARWKAVLQDGTTYHFELCQALLDRNARRFNQSLGDAITQRTETFEKQKRETDTREAALTERFIYVTGLALLRLAELCGLETYREYPTIPRLVRVAPSSKPLPLDAWTTPEAGLPA